METDLVIVPSGHIRYDKYIQGQSVLTQSDIQNMAPFPNTYAILESHGANIHQLLEQGVQFLPEFNGGFINISGASFSLDLSRPPLHRIIKNSVVIGNKPLSDKKYYTVAVPEWMASGKDGYGVLT